MNPEKHGINMGLKNMSDFRELCSIKTMCVQYRLKNFKNLLSISSCTNRYVN